MGSLVVISIHRQKMTMLLLLQRQLMGLEVAATADLQTCHFHFGYQQSKTGMTIA